MSGGNSQALDQALTMLTEPGDVVFVECPTYNLALGIIADHPVDVVGVPMDEEGLDVEALDAAVARRPGVRPPAAPALHHPDLPQPRRREPLRAAPRCACSNWRGARTWCSWRTTCTASSPTTARRRRRCGRWTRRRRSSGWLVLQVAGARAPPGLVRRAGRPARTAGGRRRARERRLRQPVLGAPGRGAARGRRLRRPRDPAAPRVRLAPRRAGGRAPRATAGRLRA